jgi:thiol-disulfide isomerase/thioredoxin
MRSPGMLLIAVCLWGFTPFAAGADYTPRDLLDRAKFKPTQPGVEYDTPTDPAAIDACKVETVYNAQKRPIGYALRDAQGKLLRKFIDTRGSNRPDQWSYYQDGFEVYRENDLDDNLTVDECRWMNAGGTRIGVVTKNRITSWKRISAEEASKVLIQALISRDSALLETVMATDQDLASLGIPKEEVERVAVQKAKRGEQVRALLADLKSAGFDEQTIWLGFNGPMPHLIPADSQADLKGDLTLYENASIFFGPPGGQNNAGKFGSLQVGEMIQVGETWKFVDLPRVVDPSKPIPALAQAGGIRAALFRAAAASPAENPDVAAAIKALADYDNQHAAALTSGDKTKLAQFYHDRIPLLNKLVELTTNPDEKLVYSRQIADSLAAAYQTGLFPKGAELLDKLAKQGGKIESYTQYRKLLAENALKAEEGGNPIAVQKDLYEKLEQFIHTYGKSDEAPEALFQFASLNEFNGDEEQARKYYGQLVRDFPNTESGKKAAGALRRLDLVGKSIDLKGTSPRGEAVDASDAKGRTLLIAFWATWAEPAKRELPELLKLYQKYRAKGFEIIAVDLDNDKAALEAFLRDNPLPWPEIFEPGGMDSRLANEYGIISLPTMFLVDPQGKVVNRNIRTAAELEKLLEKQGLDRSVNAAGLRRNR